jgi:DNA-binding CsgD family transcriptional regulator
MAPGSAVISRDAMRLLRVFAEQQGFAIAEVAPSCRITQARAIRAVANLRTVGLLVDGGHDTYLIKLDAVSALRGLLRARETGAGSALDLDLIEARASLSGVLGYNAADANPRVVKVTDHDELAKHFAQFEQLTRKELMSLHAGAAPREEMLRASMRADTALLERGVTVRVVFPVAVLGNAYIREYVSDMSVRGVQFRFTDALPHRLIISDATRAVVPIDITDLSAGAMITSEPLLVASLRYLAGTLFRRAREFADINEGTDLSGPTPTEIRMIEMISSGVTDDVAARRLAVSERTFRRHMSAMLDRLGATNRFQAGIRAVERGWI